MPKLIAIIDDEQEMEYIYALMLEDIIKTEQVEMKFFSDARLFELWLRFNHPDLILSDISMPYLSGPELGHRIRETGKTIPTYFISGHEERDFKDTMNELGVCRYLSKPINSDKFLSFIKSDLGL